MKVAVVLLFGLVCAVMADFPSPRPFGPNTKARPATEDNGDEYGNDADENKHNPTGNGYRRYKYVYKPDGYSIFNYGYRNGNRRFDADGPFATINKNARFGSDGPVWNGPSLFRHGFLGRFPLGSNLNSYKQELIARMRFLLKLLILRRLATPVFNKAGLQGIIFRRAVSFNPNLRQSVLPLRKPYLRQPISRKPYLRQPISPQPYFRQPISPQPYFRQPISPQPYLRQPISPQPFLRQPISPQPYQRQPISPQPYLRQPITPQPYQRQPKSPRPFPRQRPTRPKGCHH